VEGHCIQTPPPCIENKFTTKAGGNRTFALLEQAFFNTDFEPLRPFEIFSIPKIQKYLTFAIIAVYTGLCRDFELCPPEALVWNTRRWKIVHEILRFVPSIICLQEASIRFIHLTRQINKIALHICRSSVKSLAM